MADLTSLTTVGVDFGRYTDHTAAAVIEYHPPYFLTRGLARWPLRRPYTDVVDDLARGLSKAGSVTVAVDSTGVGAGVLEMIEAHPGFAPHVCRVHAVTITGGRLEHRYGPRKWSVPKRRLVTAVQSLLASRRLKIAPDLPGARELVDELTHFKVRISRGGHDSYGGAGGRHDDLVMALGLACWAATRVTD